MNDVLKYNPNKNIDFSYTNFSHFSVKTEKGNDFDNQIT
jgi:hypothetical protein